MGYSLPHLPSDLPIPQVFVQQGGRGWVIKIAPDKTVWGIYRSVETAGEDFVIRSASGTLCPADPRATWSDRFKEKSWKFKDNGKWVGGDIELTCDRHRY